MKRLITLLLTLAATSSVLLAQPIATYEIPVSGQNYLIFAPDGNALANIFLENRQYVLTINGERLGQYQELLPQDFQFSTKNGNYLYTFRRDNELFLRTGKQTFGPVQELIAFQYKKGDEVVKNTPLLRLSPNGEKFAFGYIQNNQDFFNLNGKIYGPFSAIYGGFIDEACENFAINYMDDGGTFINWNGKKFGPYQNLIPLKLPENFRGTPFWSYRKPEETGLFLLHEGKEWGPYQVIRGPFFSKGGSRMAFSGKSSTGEVLVVDGKEAFRLPNASVNEVLLADSTLAWLAVYQQGQESFVRNNDGENFGPFAKVVGLQPDPQAVYLPYLAYYRQGKITLHAGKEELDSLSKVQVVPGVQNKPDALVFSKEEQQHLWDKGEIRATFSAEGEPGFLLTSGDSVFVLQIGDTLVSSGLLLPEGRFQGISMPLLNKAGNQFAFSAKREKGLYLGYNQRVFGPFNYSFLEYRLADNDSIVVAAQKAAGEPVVINQMDKWVAEWQKMGLALNALPELPKTDTDQEPTPVPNDEPTELELRGRLLLNQGPLKIFDLVRISIPFENPFSPGKRAQIRFFSEEKGMAYTNFLFKEMDANTAIFLATSGMELSPPVGTIMKVTGKGDEGYFAEWFDEKNKKIGEAMFEFGKY